MDVITVTIDSKDMHILKDAKYNLCLACSLSREDYNVIWYATEAFAPVNRIELLHEYDVFASLSYPLKNEVSKDFLPITICEGDKCLLDSYGSISSPKTGAKANSIIMVNEYGNIHPGIGQRGKGVKHEIFTNPFFLSPSLILPGSFEFTLCSEVRIWFEQNTFSGMVAQYPKGNRKSRSAMTFDIQIDLNRIPNPVLRYAEGVWKII